MAIGHELGLIGRDTFQEMQERQRQITAEIQRVKNTVIKPGADVNQYLQDRGTPPLNSGVFLDQLLKRAELTYDSVETLAPGPVNVAKRVARQVEIEIKYEGYIKRQAQEVEKFRNLEGVKIPENFAFNQVHGLSNELKEKLSEVRPTSLGQASRLDGMTPAALSVLMIALKARRPGRSDVDPGIWDKPPA
jgi:tRNA uridine 5-carboxymethylaminomethyl modification enzyme